MMQRLVWLGTVVGVAAFAVGCGAAQSSDERAPVKVGSTAEALIVSNPTPPFTFPYGVNYAPYQPSGSNYYWKNYETCSGWLTQVSGPQGGIWTSGAECDSYGNNCSNFLAHPTTGTVDAKGVTDPYVTPYTHWYEWNATGCASGDLTCQAASDFFSIATAHGFKYLVDQITSISCGWAVTRDGGRQVQRCVPNSTTHSFFYSGLARIDQSWWWQPWQYQGVVAPWAQLTNPGGSTPFFDLNAYPSIGVGATSGDWKRLWDFAYTYAYPDGYYTGGQTKNIEAQHHQCSMIYRPIPGSYYTDGIAGLAIADYFVAGETNDPIGGCVGGCYW